MRSEAANTAIPAPMSALITNKPGNKTTGVSTPGVGGLSRRSPTKEAMTPPIAAVTSATQSAVLRFAPFSTDMV